MWPLDRDVLVGSAVEVSVFVMVGFVEFAVGSVQFACQFCVGICCCLRLFAVVALVGSDFLHSATSIWHSGVAFSIYPFWVFSECQSLRGLESRGLPRE